MASGHLQLAFLPVTNCQLPVILNLKNYESHK